MDGPRLDLGDPTRLLPTHRSHFLAIAAHAMRQVLDGVSARTALPDGAP
jgi:hypothetical protein